VVYKKSNRPGDDYVEAGVFETRITLHLVDELNRRKIPHRLVERDSFTSALFVLGPLAGEASQVLEEVKRRHPRVRM